MRGGTVTCTCHRPSSVFVSYLFPTAPFFLCAYFLIEYMVADYQTVTPVVPAEMRQITYIGYTGQRFLCRLDTA